MWHCMCTNLHMVHYKNRKKVKNDFWLIFITHFVAAPECVLDNISIVLWIIVMLVLDGVTSTNLFQSLACAPQDMYCTIWSSTPWHFPVYEPTDLPWNLHTNVTDGAKVAHELYVML